MIWRENPLFLETPISTHTAALAAEAPHTSGFCWLGAVSETPEMCALRAKTHQRWKYWVPSSKYGCMISFKNKKQKQLLKIYHRRRKVNMFGGIMWKLSECFFQSYGGECKYYVYIYTYIDMHIANVSVLGSFLSNIILWIHDVMCIYIYYTQLLYGNRIRINSTYCSKPIMISLGDTVTWTAKLAEITASNCG